MRRKQITALALAALMLLTLAACGGEKDDDKTESADMTVRPLELSQEETALTELLNIGMSTYRMFDFQLGEKAGVQSVMLRAYELEGGDWVDIATQAYPFSDPTGRIALTFGKMPEGVKTAIQSESGTNSNFFTPVVEGDVSAMTYATSVLTASTQIEWDQEIPLALQTVTSKSEFSTYNVEYFGMPRELFKHDFDHVYAVTVTFSQKSVSDVVQAVAPGIPQTEPTAEPSPAQ